jgi:uncharacterized protein YcbK (DUF882 family)
MNRPSKNLSWRELACKDGTPYPQEWRKNRAIILAEVFELIRAACGDKSISVLSAYRSYLHNKKIGGAKNSQHLQGRALDLRPPDGYTVNEFYEIIKLISPLTAIRGIGKYKTFVHVDIRPTAMTYWFGTGVKDS